MVSAPRGLLKLIALQLLSESSLSGADLQTQIRRSSGDVWRPGPGSIYFMIKELREGGLIVELPATGGTMRRYVISNKGKTELERKKAEVGKEVKKQLEILAYYSDLAGHHATAGSLKTLASRM